jgi:GlpG protein
MRQLATLPDERAARALADYLLTLRIDTRLNQEPEGWVVWVCDEDRLPQARQELAEFSRNPSDARFTNAARTAQALRVKQARDDAAYQRKQINLRDRWADRAGRPSFTYALIAASVAVSLATTGLGRPAEPGQVLLLRALSIATEDQTVGELVARGEVWRLVTPIFIHFGVWHILFNMLMLYQLGGAIELRRGTGRYALLVLLLAVVSNLAQYYLGGYHPGDGWSLPLPNPHFGGMSGVVYGLIGYIWMKGRYEPHLGLVLHPQTLMWAIIWFFLCMTGAVGPIANVAHAGGLVTGITVSVAPHLWRRMRGVE